MQFLQLNGEVVVKRESSPVSDLELGISSRYGGVKSKIKEEADQIVFTAAQIQELCIQAAIFRYLLSGLPVPIHLVLPIWTSVASSLGSDSSGICRHFPILATVFSFGRDFDYRSLMDPEPGRCRRTDGKKWRCYKEVVPLQKYCEKHMHRGSNRSRKRVETAEDASAISSKNHATSLTSSMVASADSRTPVAVSTSLDLTVPCSNSAESDPGTFKDGSAYTSNGDLKKKCKRVAGEYNGTNASSLVRVLADKNNTKYQSDYRSGKGVGDSDHIITSKMDGGNNNTFSVVSTAPGFGLSPKSVLQHEKATVCTRLKLEYKMPEETEPTRCKRSDGRKWRCKRDVMPDKKYCEIHVSRGSKRVISESKMVIGMPVYIPQGIPTACTTPSTAENKMHLNTNLSISITGSPQKISNGDSSSSEATDCSI